MLQKTIKFVDCKKKNAYKDKCYQKHKIADRKE